MPVSPIHYRDLSIQVYERIKKMITSGELKPGEKIRQEQIANLLGVSRMPLHKAFQILEDQMLVVSIPRRGIFVHQPTLKEYIEAFECRQALEGIAVRKAAVNMTNQQISELKNLFIPFFGQEPTNITEYRKADRVFHESIMQVSGNKLLQKLNGIGNVLIKTFPKGILLGIKDSLNDHMNIIHALENRNADLAEKHMKYHVGKALEVLTGELNERKNT